MARRRRSRRRSRGFVGSLHQRRSFLFSSQGPLFLEAPAGVDRRRELSRAIKARRRPGRHHGLVRVLRSTVPELRGVRRLLLGTELLRVGGNRPSSVRGRDRRVLEADRCKEYSNSASARPRFSSGISRLQYAIARKSREERCRRR